MNSAAIASQGVNPPAMNPQGIDPQTLNLRDIHLPDPISWWPPAPGWWLLLSGFVLLLVSIYMLRKIYRSRQLKRDIKTQIEHIKRQFAQTNNKSQLAKSLSILLRRASISFYPARTIAGLTGEKWLALLDQSNVRPLNDLKFQSDIGKVLISAPYQSEASLADYDSVALIRLCESWLLSSHSKPLPLKEVAGS
ncbi:MAG: DUF4381 domain-containing protein [Gammaproteobacteria bacterium]|nr:DUF4381 domain-containing protein [Gammaproteobacteria bacterium]